MRFAPAAAISACAMAQRAALFAALLAMGACSKPMPDPVAATPVPVQTSAASAAGAPDTSVPDAAAVLSAAPAASVDPGAGRSNTAMSRAQEASAMPMPGQNNDHSAPLASAPRASGR
jgi:hypothetical protein